VAVVLFGLALVCALVAGITLVDFGDGATLHPPTNESVDAPGVGYAGVVGAQEAEVRDEYDTRSFEIQLTQASDPASRAAVVANETRRLEASLERLETRRNLLENDDEPAYRSRVTSFVAQSVVTEKRLDRTRRAAETLPPAVRKQYGLTPATFRTLQDRTDTLVTPEMMAVARGVAGDDVGDDFDDSDDDDVDDSDDDDVDDSDDDDVDDETGTGEAGASGDDAGSEDSADDGDDDTSDDDTDDADGASESEEDDTTERDDGSGSDADDTDGTDDGSDDDGDDTEETGTSDGDDVRNSDDGDDGGDDSSDDDDGDGDGDDSSDDDDGDGDGDDSSDDDDGGDDDDGDDTDD
jgi:hypothetical protein